jgi:protein TonB
LAHQSARARPIPRQETTPTPVTKAPAVQPMAAPTPTTEPAEVNSAKSTAGAPPAELPRFDPAYLNNQAPVYPTASRRLGEQGRVLLRVYVRADGSAREALVDRSSGSSRLDAAARKAVERWRFVPAKRGNDAVDAWVIVPISFSLEG